MSNDVEWSKNCFSEGRLMKTPDSVTRVMCFALGTGGTLGNQIGIWAYHVCASLLQTVLLVIETVM